MKCVGTASNRDGIGAKIRLKARIRGTDTWQLREISGGTGFGQTPLLGHFGFGDATTVDTLRIEWPSGAVQELHDVAIRRTITVVEPPQLQIRRTVDSMEICVIGDPAETYRVQSSENLSHWVERALLTNAVRTNVLHESSVAAHRFFRSQTVR